MKAITVFILVLALSLAVLAQETKSVEVKSANGQFKEARSAKHKPAQSKKEVIKAENSTSQKSAAKIEVIRSDQVKSAKPKDRPVMGSAVTSGPAVKIKEMNVPRTATDEDLRNALGDPNPVKKKTNKN